MKKETIYHPEMRDTAFGNTERSPRLSHITVEHDDPLGFSPNPIIQKLIVAGWDVHACLVQVYMAFPRNAFMLGAPFVMEEREEFQIDIKGVGYLRFRFENPTRGYLVLFSVDIEKQGKGLGRVWYPRVIDALFRAGFKYVWGRVEPPFQRGAWTFDQERLIGFYVKNGFLSLGDERIWMFSPYRDSDDACTRETATVGESETATVLQS